VSQKPLVGAVERKRAEVETLELRHEVISTEIGRHLIEGPDEVYEIDVKNLT